METISHYANVATHAATKAIWGEQPNHQEPVNGRMGNVAAGQPYDAGNIESASTALKTTTPNPDLDQPEVSHVESPATAKDSRKDFNENANPAAQRVALPTPTPSEQTVQRPPPATSASHPEDTATSKSGPESDNNPSAAIPSSDLPQDSTKSQNDTRSPSHVDNTDNKKEPDALDANNNPVNIDGPGPKPLEVLAKERGGDAGVVSQPSDKEAEGGHGNEAKKTTESDGTGELYVKSKGLAADGGDFDASKPGAGREADRLLEEKGIHHTEGKRAEAAGEKKHHHLFGKDREGGGLKEKIKAKLHRGN